MSTTFPTQAPPPAGAAGPAARAEGLTKIYGSGDAAVRALDGVDVSIDRGAFTAVMGPSGSGKSTLMHCLAGLDSPTSGRVWVGDTEITGLSDRELTRLRRTRIGFVFQSFNLMPTMTAKDNILLPTSLAGGKVDPEWFEVIVDTLGLRDRLGHRPSEMSGGQQQRVATARALVGRPDVVFADEPTGALDSATGNQLLEFLRRSAVEFGQTIVMVTHDPSAAAYADRVMLFADGRPVGALENPDRDTVIDALREVG